MRFNNLNLLKNFMKEELNANLSTLHNKYWDICSLSLATLETYKKYLRGEVSFEYVCNVCSKKVAESEKNKYDNAMKKIEEIEKVSNEFSGILEVRTMGNNKINVKFFNNHSVYEENGKDIDKTIINCLMKCPCFEKQLYLYINELSFSKKLQNEFDYQYNKKIPVCLCDYVPKICFAETNSKIDEDELDGISKTSLEAQNLLKHMNIIMTNEYSEEIQDCFRYKLNNQNILY